MTLKQAEVWIRAGRTHMRRDAKMWIKATENRLIWQWDHHGAAILAEVQAEELRQATGNAIDEIFDELKLTT
jgi:hypothetical protein